MKSRLNMVTRQSENWKPPIFEPILTPRDRAVAALRRLFDLQVGSLWKDLEGLLGDLKGSVVDVGCGAQPFRSLVPSETCYIGIDTDYAKANFGYEIPDTIYYHGDTWPLQDAGIDNVLCTETLEHIAEPKLFLLEMARVLKPGGTVLLSVPFAARWHFIPYDYWRYTPSSLKILLEQTGFEEIAVYARGNALTVACYKNMALFLPFLFSKHDNLLTTVLARTFGLLTFPCVAFFALIGNLSLNLPGGDDCLGYTVTAKRARL